MKNKDVQKLIANTFNRIAEDLEQSVATRKTKIGITTLGSNTLINNIVKAAEATMNNLTSCEIVLIGKKVDTVLENIEISQNNIHVKMEQLLDNGMLDVCITSNYNFPIGVATIGRIITPHRGREMFIASTTGSLSSNRIEAMIKNAIYGISTAKACGIKNPSVGILNVDGAIKVEKALQQLNDNGYKINFAKSIRSSKNSCIMRGNDLLTGTPDVMVQDTLTGNILIKVFSSFMSGGESESVGYGYGPGLSDTYKRNILIISRASGIPVISNAIRYAIDLVNGKINNTLNNEIRLAEDANLSGVLKIYAGDKYTSVDGIIPPKQEIVNSIIAGIDILDLDSAIGVLWQNGIYGESGMGCVGPVILINEHKREQAVDILKNADYIGYNKSNC